MREPGSEVVERLVHSFAIISAGEVVCAQTMEETVASGETLEDLFFRYIVQGKVEDLEWIA